MNMSVKTTTEEGQCRKVETFIVTHAKNDDDR